MQVTVTDSTAVADAQDLQVTVTDVNEAPTIANQSFGVNENTPNSTSVGTVVATDLDAGDSLTYAITGGNTGGAFAIDAATGEITVATTGEITVANSAALDFETTPSFGLTVQVTDSGALSDSATVTINLTDVNDAPTIGAQVAASIANAPPVLPPVIA